MKLRGVDPLSILLGMYLAGVFFNYAAKDWCEKDMPPAPTVIESHEKED